MSYTLSILLLIALFSCSLVDAYRPAIGHRRFKRQSNFLLPTDADTFLKAPLKTQFRCVRTGYFADIDNNCQMYHVCIAQETPLGHKNVRQYSFVCGNGTMFNQLTMNCDDPNESLPCEDAPRFYRLNDKIGHRTTPLHSGDDWAEEDSGYDPSDYVGSASHRYGVTANRDDTYDASDEDNHRRPLVGRTSYGSSTHSSNSRIYSRHRSSAGHHYAENNSRFRPNHNVRYFVSNRPVSGDHHHHETTNRYVYRPAPSSYGSSAHGSHGHRTPSFDTHHTYEAESSHTSEVTVPASEAYKPSAGSSPDLSANEPGIYFYRRREVPYDG